MKNLEKIKTFLEELNDIGKAEWHDDYGVYSVQIGDNLMEEYKGKIGYRFLISDFLDLDFHTNSAYSHLVSIGGFQVHNQGKKESQTLNMDLTTIPIPLSNDSFGTNRYSITDSEQSPSITSKYPRQTLFDLSELSRFGISHSIYGVGEFIGLYYSVIDYSLKDGNNPDEECLNYIVFLFDELIQLFNKKEECKILSHIAKLLIFKCLIMRNNKDHRIGCGIDHSIARILERDNRFTHGKAVYMASLVVSLLYPEWGKWGINYSLLFDKGRLLGLIGKDDFIFLKQIKIEELVQEAIKIRLDRKTMLRYLSENNFFSTQQHLNHLVWDTLN